VERFVVRTADGRHAGGGHAVFEIALEFAKQSLHLAFELV
jgi:hypothetical protein